MGNKEKKLARMKLSPHSWGPDSVETLLAQFGFESRGGTKHAYYVDPDDEANIIRVPRHKPVKEYVVQQVVESIERRLARQEPDE